MQRLRLYSVELTLTAILGLAVFFFGYLGYGLVIAETDVNFSGERALLYVERQLAFGPRITGSTSSEKMTDWLVDELRGRSWDVVIEPFPMLVTGQAAEAVLANGIELTNEQTSAEDENAASPATIELIARNIIAIREPEVEQSFFDDLWFGLGQSSEEGRDGDDAKRVGMLVTRYDTRLFADLDDDEANKKLAVPGANGGASGTAVLLELARTLSLQLTDHTMCLVFLDGEANRGIDGWSGYMGGHHLTSYLERDVPDCAEPEFVVALDMVGYIDQEMRIDISLLTDTSSDSSELNRGLWRMADNLDHSDYWINEQRIIGPNFHTAFVETGVPVAIMIDDGYPYRATVADRFDKVNIATLGRVGRMLEVWLEGGAQY